MTDESITAAIRAAQEAAGTVLSARLSGDITACVIIVPVYVRAMQDPASGWRAEAIADATRQIEQARPPLARIHVIQRAHD